MGVVMNKVSSFLLTPIISVLTRSLVVLILGVCGLSSQLLQRLLDGRCLLGEE